MRDKLCRNCQFWEINRGTPEGELNYPASVIGLCRKVPPVIIEGVVQWPVTYATDWCGGYYQNYEDGILGEVTDHIALALKKAEAA